ncbi:hypothetical protein OIU85_005921, partial [Salix viminalis]
MSVNKSAMDRKKLAVEEEVDHVYERLQALEADREFLKHCITSSRKGDKGIELLQDILQTSSRSKNRGATCKELRRWCAVVTLSSAMHIIEDN